MRACSSQKCVRAGGKHNDLDEVGKTARHQTFFEMLGNFSFGDYFKEDAIKFAWDLLVNEFKLDPARLWFTVFDGDDEVPAGRRRRAASGNKSARRANEFCALAARTISGRWARLGPAGRAAKFITTWATHPKTPEQPRRLRQRPRRHDMEIWNLVFMQYNRVEEAPGKYKLEPLPAPSVDTGMGLERVTAVLQGVKSNYETDLIRPIIEFTATTRRARNTKRRRRKAFAMRVIADHARATAFLIADGILPGNEGRNYVLRKIMRRAHLARKQARIQRRLLRQSRHFVVDPVRRSLSGIARDPQRHRARGDDRREHL